MISASQTRRSGLPWISEVPAHWEIKRAKLILRELDLRTATGDELLLSVSQYTGVAPRKTRGDSDEQDTRSESLVGYKKVTKGDLVINIMLAWNGSLGASNFDGVVSPAYCVYRFQGENHPDYYHHLLRTEAYKGRIKVDSRGVVDSRLRLYSENLFRIELPVPPPDEQEQIVRFVRHLDSKVTRLIKAKRRLIELLNEQKQAIIHQAVTRGLDPNVPLKSSGVEWIGEIPEHWEVRRVKQLSTILRGKFTHRPRNEPTLYDGEFPFIQTGEVARAEKVIQGYRQTLNEKGLAVSKMFPAGTLVMTIAANIGEVAVLDFDACFPDSIVGFVPKPVAERDFLYYAFVAMKEELLREAPVNTQGNLNVDRIGCRELALPPVSEQGTLVTHIEESTEDLNRTIQTAKSEIDLIREYRTRLVADVVTGQLDVRNVEIPALEDELNETMDDYAEEELEDSDEILEEVEA